MIAADSAPHDPEARDALRSLTFCIRALDLYLTPIHTLCLPKMTSRGRSKMKYGFRIGNALASANRACRSSDSTLSSEPMFCTVCFALLEPTSTYDAPGRPAAQDSATYAIGRPISAATARSASTMAKFF